MTSKRAGQGHRTRTRAAPAPHKPREPFERLVASGLRLNELGSEAEWREFLIGEVAELCRARRVLLLLEGPQGVRIGGARLPAGEDAAALLRAVTPWLQQARRSRAASLRHGPAGAEPIDQRSCVVAPLLAQRELLGFLYADIEGAGGRLHEADRDRLALLAAQAAPALARLRAAERLFDEVQRRGREATALAEVGRDLSSALDLPTVLNGIARHAKELLAADHSAIFLPTPDGRGHRALVALGAAAEPLMATTVEAGHGILGSLLQGGTAEVINDTRADPRDAQSAGTEPRNGERLMAVPLVGGAATRCRARWRCGAAAARPSTPASSSSSSACRGRPRSRCAMRGCSTRRAPRSSGRRRARRSCASSASRRTTSSRCSAPSSTARSGCSATRARRSSCARATTSA